MPSSFHGLNIASSGLKAQQTALNVAGHNIANANTPHYSRQQAVLHSRSLCPDRTTTMLGSGAEVATIRRIQDHYIADRIRGANQGLAYGQAGKQALDQIVSIFGEPSDQGLSSDLDQFWNAWQAISVQPESTANRQNVLQFGQTVATHLNQFSDQLESLRRQQELAVGEHVESINRLTEELAGVNDQIQRASGQGDAPNDLLGRREAILHDLSQIAEIRVSGEGGAEDIVSIGGHVLVQGNHASALSARTDEAGRASVHRMEGGDEIPVRGGHLEAALDLSREKIPEYLATLDRIAQGLMARVNELHRSGTGLDGGTGRDFFTGAGARDLRVNSELAGQPRRIAASVSGAPGDGSLALALAGVKSEGQVNGATINETYRGLIAHTASDAAGFDREVQIRTQIQRQLSLQQQSVSGVNLDEEMTDMIRFQQAYNASARVVSAMDEMLSILIERLGG